MCTCAKKIFLVGVVNWLKWAEMCRLHLTLFPDTKRGEAFCTHTPKFRKFAEMSPQKILFHSGPKPRDSKALQAQARLIDRGQLVRLKNAIFRIGTAAGVTSPRLRLASALGRKGSGGAARLFRPTSGGLGGVWSHAWKKGTRIAPEVLFARKRKLRYMRLLRLR